MTDEIKTDILGIDENGLFGLGKDKLKEYIMNEPNTGSDKLEVYSIEELQRQIYDTIQKYFADNRWWVKVENAELPEMRPANNEETELYQAFIRKTRFAIQMLKEAEIANLELKKRSVGPTTELLKQVAMYRPLVSRRNHPNVTVPAQDGELFTFHPQDFYKVCKCTDEQLRLELQDGLVTTDEDVRIIRELHSEKLNGQLCSTMYQSFNCANPKTITKYQAKHSVGNWHCKACLNTPTEITDAESANNLSGTKAIDWCPKFIPLLRSKSLDEYMQATKSYNTVDANSDNYQNVSANVTCYAGLLHSEMTFVEEEYTTPTKHMKTFVVITKKCDTCGYTIEEKKEYHQPKPIQPGETLQEL